MEAEAPLLQIALPEPTLGVRHQASQDAVQFHGVGDVDSEGDAAQEEGLRRQQGTLHHEHGKARIGNYTNKGIRQMHSLVSLKSSLGIIFVNSNHEFLAENSDYLYNDS